MTPMKAQTTEEATFTWRSGDVGKCITIVLSLSFLGCVFLNEQGKLNIFDESFRDAGFCMSSDNTRSWALQSHAISFYADAIMALFMMMLVRRGRHHGMRNDAFAPMRKNAYTLSGHGCGHLFLAIFTTDNQVFEMLSPWQKLAAFVALLPVWYGFMSDSRRGVYKSLAFAIVHDALQILVIPTRFFFTHVLMAVLLNSAIRKLAMQSHEKNIYYDLESCLVDVPILLAAFVEGMACDSFLIYYGGHVWFDMVVPVMFTVYYLILLHQHRIEEPKTKKL